MSSARYRRRVNATAVIASAAFAGGNLFIGLSMGAYWLRLDPLEFAQSFGPQFRSFLLTIMPLFLSTLLGLALSARLDWADTTPRRNWLIAIGLYVVMSLMTLGYHMPENLRLLAGGYSAAEADAARTYWLAGHVPRILLAAGIPVFALRAVYAQRDSAR